MGYKLDKKKPLPEALRRVAHAEVTAAQAALEELSAEEAVHEVRKHCKKLRALLRLVRKDTENLYRYENAHYRTLADALSGSRDAVSMRDIFLKVVPANEFDEVREFLDQRADQHADPEAMAEAGAMLEQGEERIDEWPLDELGWKHARRGYRDYYKRARKAMDKAFEHESAETFHDFRKRVKDHWYHTRLLKKKYKSLGKRRKPLRDLSRALGDWRDLHLLCSLLAPRSGEFSGKLIPLLDLANARMKDLREEIDRLAGELFSEKKPSLDS
ncbi:CHAD domain-containing protein [Microbulbifer yueqingensis]|uniref:CHAD domain-containing protein n=1 Tax=Microbulbifer yueqingensis TaxID=658219 RepID=A0A1G9BE96_9GAMM|nr:CHAD domain-containing protein [Microbulbifer yueqingensis]SDK37862.1 CHAD domain-containing protein [Microbulbifer yueqingensis]